MHITGTESPLVVRGREQKNHSQNFVKHLWNIKNPCAHSTSAFFLGGGQMAYLKREGAFYSINRHGRKKHTQIAFTVINKGYFSKNDGTYATCFSNLTLSGRLKRMFS